MKGSMVAEHLQIFLVITCIYLEYNSTVSLLLFLETFHSIMALAFQNSHISAANETREGREKKLPYQFLVPYGSGGL
jgi:hypothetical protein